MPCFPCPVHHLLVTVIHLLPLHLVPSCFSDHGVVVFFLETCHASEDLRRERLFRRLSRARQWPVGGLAPFGEYWPPRMGVCRNLHGGTNVGPMPPSDATHRPRRQPPASRPENSRQEAHACGSGRRPALLSPPPPLLPNGAHSPPCPIPFPFGPLFPHLTAPLASIFAASFTCLPEIPVRRSFRGPRARGAPMSPTRSEQGAPAPPRRPPGNCASFGRRPGSPAAAVA